MMRGTRCRSTETAKIVFLCTGSINSVSLLLRSASDAYPGGLGNSSGLLGKCVVDHAFGAPIMSTIPGISDRMYLGRKPNGVIIPRFVNVDREETDFHRSYSFQGFCMRDSWTCGEQQAGIGVAFKESLRWSDNERRAYAHAQHEALAMLGLLQGEITEVRAAAHAVELLKSSAL